MSTKAEGITGIVSVSILGVSAALTPDDATAWGVALQGLAPLILFCFLLWRIYKLDKQHQECTANNERMQEQIILMYRAAQNVQIRRQLPLEEDFKEGNFDLNDHVKQGK
jgi:hypothetical protein